MTEDEMVGWHHQLDGHEFEQPLGVGVGQGSLASDAVVSLAETCIKNKNFKRISQSAGKRINESVGGQREEEKNK